MLGQGGDLGRPENHLQRLESSEGDAPLMIPLSFRNCLGELWEELSVFLGAVGCHLELLSNICFPYFWALAQGVCVHFPHPLHDV